MRRIALIGAGYIADVHAEAITALDGLTVSAVVDPAPGRAQALAKKWGAANVFDSVGALIEDGAACDAAHVLVPPPLHRPVAETLLRAGLPVFLEKPMAETDADCAALEEAAREGKAYLGINQNFVYHPIQQAMKSAIRLGEMGPLRHVTCTYFMPLRQLAARQFGHWMFDRPRNLLLEQAVHPLSQIVDLAGPILDMTVRAGKPRAVAEGFQMIDRWSVALQCERASAQLEFRLGCSYPVWRIDAACDDGEMSGDYLHDRQTRQTPTRWMDFFDGYANGVGVGRQLIGQSRRSALRYVLSTAKLRPRSDSFFLGMKDSIAAYHEALPSGDPAQASFARGLVAACEAIDRASPKVPAPPKVKMAKPGKERFDVVVFGGTGFIGKHLVQRLVDQGKRVAVAARGVRNLPALFAHEKVSVFPVDIGNRDSVASLVATAPVVVNLAHGGGGANWAAIERSMVGGARTVAECCLEAGTERLIFVSSIAALYLGDSNSRITCDTPPDPAPQRRGDYARAKVLAERAMLAMHRERHLPVVVVRPGVVVGEGGSPFHSGIGLYNREAHCLGWNAGDNPLPLVLVGDVADGIIRAMEAPDVLGRSFNLIGDVRLSASEYTAELAKLSDRRLYYHPQSLAGQQAVEVFKWLVKRAAGRRDAAFPSYADLKSRGLPAQFDTAEEKRVLGWAPVGDRETFVREAFFGYGR